MINRRKRQTGAESNVFRSMGSRPQISFKWGAKPLNPFDEEAKRNRLLPPERLMADQLQLYKDTLRKNATKKNAAHKQALETVLMSSELPQNIRDLQDREAEQFTKDFMCWLQGKQPKSKSDPAYIDNRLKQYGIDPNHGPLHGPGITEFIGSVVEKKAELHQKIALLAAGPDKMFPWGLDHYWLFYKYLCRDKPYPEDEMLYDFDKYWPNESKGRPDKSYKALGDPEKSYYGYRNEKSMKIPVNCKTNHPDDPNNGFGRPLGPNASAEPRNRRGASSNDMAIDPIPQPSQNPHVAGPDATVLEPDIVASVPAAPKTDFEDNVDNKPNSDDSSAIAQQVVDMLKPILVGEFSFC